MDRCLSPFLVENEPLHKDSANPLVIFLGEGRG